MAKRSYGTGHLYIKADSYYGRWRTPDDRLLNRKIGPVRKVGHPRWSDPRAGRASLRPAPGRRSPPALPARADRHTVLETSESLRRQLRLQGSRRSYLENVESMERVHIAPRLGTKELSRLRTTDVEALAEAMLTAGLSPKTVRNVISYLHSTFEHAIARGWTVANPVRHAARPKRRRATDADPDLQFLSVAELNAVIRAIPGEVVHRTPAPTRQADAAPLRRRRPTSSAPCCVRSSGRPP